MMLTKREQKIGVVTVAVIIILALDRFLLTPYLETRERLDSEKQKLIAELRKSRAVLAEWKEMPPLWEEIPDGETETGAAGREGDALSAIRSWSEESRMTLSLLKPEGKEKKGKLAENIFQVVGTGTMSSVSMFLWKVENASRPSLKIKDMQLAARKEGVDDLTLQVRIGELNMESLLLPELSKPGEDAKK